MCACRDERICVIAKVYEKGLRDCFPAERSNLFTLEVLAEDHLPINTANFLFEVRSTGMRLWEQDIILYEFDAENKQSLPYFNFHCLSETRLLRTLNEIGKSFEDYHAAQKIYFYESLQQHNIWWNYREL